MADEWGTEAWSDRQVDLWGDIVEFGVTSDGVAESLFHAAYFEFDRSTDEINAIRDTLDQYLMDEYGIDFDAAFDWEAYREMYGGE